MNAVDCIRMTLTMGDMTIDLIDDMKDAPLTAPTSKGGNHPLWILGHLTYSEATMVYSTMLGKPNPLEDWKPIFGEGTEPTDDASAYPPFDEVRARFNEVRSHTLKLLDGLTDADLDHKSQIYDEEWAAYYDTYGKVLTILGAHTFMHHGQVADARRSAGRKPKM